MARSRAQLRADIADHWPGHFDPDVDPFAAEDPRVGVCELFVDFFVDEAQGEPLLAAAAAAGAGGGAVLFDFPAFAAAWRNDDVDLGIGLRDTPEDFLACASVAASVAAGRRLTARFTGVDAIPLSQLKASAIGKFVRVRGTVVRLSNVRPLPLSVEFWCARCQATVRQTLVDGKYETPRACPNDCKSRKFQLDQASAVTADFQTLKLQEIDDSNAEAGRIPRTVQVEIRDDLVDACVPGDVVDVCGVVKTVNAEIQAGKRNKTAHSTALFQLYIEANSVVSARGGGGEDKLASFTFTDSDMRAFQDLAQSPRCFETLVHSLCPAIFGHDLVKAGLVLALFGGAQRYAQDKNRIVVRGDPHVLVVGDPGLGKSQMLHALKRVAPRAVYVCGNTSSSTGLTVTVVRDGPDTSLEAGALVLADQGVCLIDELDKLSESADALLEAMEQQRISVAKAGIVASLSARCSVVAAANPVDGHYDRAKTVRENLHGMSTALLSRFDIVFILLDRPNHGHDQLLSDHILALHRGGAASSGPGAGAGAGRPEVAVGDGDEDELLRRLVAASQTEHAVPVPLLRKYVAYARRAVQPVLTPAAAEVLQGLYLDMRSAGRGSDGPPITTRQLEALIRLAQARARCELRAEVTVAHARDVVQIMQSSLVDAFTTEAGEVTFDFAGGGNGGGGLGRGASLSKQIKGFLKAAKAASSRRGSTTFSTAELIGVADSIGLAIDDFGGFLDTLREQCYVLKRGSNLWQVQLGFGG